jgi:hypothetical protein
MRRQVIKSTNRIGLHPGFSLDHGGRRERPVSYMLK